MKSMLFYLKSAFSHTPFSYLTQIFNYYPLRFQTIVRDKAAPSATSYMHENCQQRICKEKKILWSINIFLMQTVLY